MIKRLDCSIYEEVSSCPICGACASAFHKDGSYDRDLICYEKELPVYHTVTIRCVACSCCGHSHALEPSIIIPYSPFSIGFCLSVIYAKISCRFQSVLELCAHFDISVSTYYRILKKYMMDASILAPLIKGVMSIPMAYEFSYFKLHQLVRSFFQVSGYSFLQPRIRLRPHILMKELPPNLSRYIENGSC